METIETTTGLHEMHNEIYHSKFSHAKTNYERRTEEKKNVAVHENDGSEGNFQ